MSERLTGRDDESAYLELEGRFKGNKVRFLDDKETMNAYYSRKVINKLVQFEDFMEEFGFESFEEFLMAVKLMQAMNNVGVKEYSQNKVLKTRWEKLKEYAHKHFEEDEGGLALGFKKILNKMQELEKESEDEE